MESLNKVSDYFEWKKNKPFTYSDHYRDWMNSRKSGNAEIIAGTACRVMGDMDDMLELMADYGDDKLTCRSIFEEKMKNFSVVDSAALKNTDIWFNTTTGGINIRPGLISEKDYIKDAAVVMKNEDVHGVIVGRTGAGKSVLLNGLLVNLMAEYAPWELALYLIDFKKVELSKYVTDPKARSPHVRVCAATGEVRYALSLISYIREEMEKRETLLSRMGFADIETLREYYPELVVPRILLVVDEFQQMFLDATGKQSDQIQDILTAITRKGRATGVHLLFASQEMSGTGVKLSNFKMRFALSCNAEVSMDILGNSEASKLPAHGFVILNDKSGKAEENVKYKVPLINDDERSKLLSRFHKQAEDLGCDFTKDQKYYLEDRRPAFSALKEMLEQPVMREISRRMAADPSGQFFLPVLFGRSVVYNKKEFDIENVKLERGRNRNILAVSPNVEDLAYIMKLLMANFTSTPYDVSGNKGFNYTFFDLNPALSAAYPDFARDAADGGCARPVTLKSIEDSSRIIEKFKMRSNTNRLLGGNISMSDFFVRSYYDRNIKTIEMVNPGAANVLNNGFNEINLNELLEKEEPESNVITIAAVLEMGRKLMSVHPENWKSAAEAKAEIMNINMGAALINLPLTGSVEEVPLIENVRRYAAEIAPFYYYAKIARDSSGRNIPLFQIHRPEIVFFGGINTVSNYSKDLCEFMRDCMSVNMYCVFLSTETVDPSVKNSSNYFLVSGLEDELYEKYIQYTTGRKMDSIVIEARIKSLSRIFAFKKYKTEKVQRYAFDLDLDSIMKGMT